MEYKNIWKNFTGSVFAVGMVITSMKFNDTPIVGSLSPRLPAYYASMEGQAYNTTTNQMQYEPNNVYFDQRSSIEIEAENLFGQMREATDQESASVNNYVRNISKNTGVNFFSLC